MAAVNAYVGAFYLLMYAGWPKAREHLPFSLLCFSVAAYDVACMGLYTSTDLEQGVFWQGLQLAAVNPISASVVWFVTVLTGQERNRVVRAFLAAFLLLFPATLLIRGPGLTLSLDTPAIKSIMWGGRPLITYYESTLGLLSNAAVLVAIIAYGYVFVLLWRAYSRGPGGALTAIVAGQVTYFVGIVNDIFVANQVYAFVYVSEYSYLAIVLIMAGVLLRRFVGLYRIAEDASRTLEHQVIDAQADLKVLRGLLPICASCKKIRDDGGYWNQLESYISDHSDATFSHGICPDCAARLYPDLMGGGGEARPGEPGAPGPP